MKELSLCYFIVCEISKSAVFAVLFIILTQSGKKMKKLKFYDVTAISPITGRETTYHDVPACHLSQNDSGELRFVFSNFFDTVEVITATLSGEEKQRQPDL